MSNAKVVFIDSFQHEKVSLGKLRDNRTGLGKNAHISYEGGRFYLAITDIRFPFGASSKPDQFKKGDKDPWTLQCELNATQIERFKRLDEHIVDSGVNNPDVLAAMKLTGKKKEIVKELLGQKYFSVLKYSKDRDGKVKEQFQPTIRVTIPNDGSNGFQCDFYRSGGSNSEPVKISNSPDGEDGISKFLPPDSRGSVLVTLSLWFSTVGFGLTLRANQIKASPPKSMTLTKGVCLLDGLSGPSDKVNADPESLSEAELPEEALET